VCVYIYIYILLVYKLLLLIQDPFQKGEISIPLIIKTSVYNICFSRLTWNNEFRTIKLSGPGNEKSGEQINIVHLSYTFNMCTIAFSMAFYCAWHSQRFSEDSNNVKKTIKIIAIITSNYYYYHYNNYFYYNNI